MLSSMDSKCSHYPGMRSLTAPIPRPVSVAAIQFSMSDSIEDNIATATRLVIKASESGANIILLPELFATKYFCQKEHASLFSLAGPAETHLNPLLSHFQSLSAKLHVVLPVSFFEVDKFSHYNSIKVYDDGKELEGLYRKSHIPTGPGYQEKFYFTPGNTGFKVWNTRFGKISCAICWDQWHSEAAKCMALQGAELLFYPTAIGSEPEDPNLDSSSHWRTVMRGHAAANMCPVIAANRIGKELDITFYGTSFITDGTGGIVEDTKKGEGEKVLVHKFDLQKLETERVGWGIFRDRRPELYGALIRADGRDGDQDYRKYYTAAPPRSQSSKSSSCSSSSSLASGYHVLTANPSSLGYQMPAEWSPHSGCYIIFPYRPDNWRLSAEPAQRTFASFATQLSEFENVTVLATSETWEKARELCGEKVKVIEMASDDSWMRDSGPIFVVNKSTKSIAGIHWHFNAWGGSKTSKYSEEDVLSGAFGCYPSWQKDCLIPRKLLSSIEIPEFVGPIVLEGGSIHVDGEGTCLVTEQCLLHWNRWDESKPAEKLLRESRTPRNKQEIEAVLCEYLGVSKVIWLEYGLYADNDTNGHIDNMACFASPGNIILSWTDDQKDPQYQRSLSAYERLSNTTDAKGRKITIHKLHLPEPLYYSKEEVDTLSAPSDGKTHEKGANAAAMRNPGARIPASYVNFYIGNGCVFVPGFNDSVYDSKAKEVLSNLFPDRKVVQIYARDIVLGGGNLHCITQQQPAL